MFGSAQKGIKLWILNRFLLLNSEMWIRTAIKSPTTPCIWWKSLASPWETITVRIGLKFVSTMCSCDPTSLFPLVTPSCLALELPACLFPKAVCQPSLVLGIYLWYWPALSPFTLIARSMVLCSGLLPILLPGLATDWDCSPDRLPLEA